MHGLLAILLFAAGSACDTGPSAPPDPLKIQTRQASQHTAEAGDTLESLTVRVRTQANEPVAGVVVLWEASGGAPSATSSTTDDAGEARVDWRLGTTPGTVRLVARIEGTQDTAVFTALVTGGPPATIELDRDQARLRGFGDTVRIAVTALDRFGNASGRPVVWTSADTLVAAVDSVGFVVAAGGGLTTVSASYDGVSDEVAIEVPLPVVTFLECPPGTEVPTPRWMSSVARITGACRDSAPTTDLYQFQPIRWMDLVPSVLPGGTSFGAVSINEAGAVAGIGVTANGGEYAIRWSAAGVLDTLLPPRSISSAIDDAGTVVGHFFEDQAPWAFAARDGAIDTLSSEPGRALAINSAGVAVGHFGTGPDLRAVAWHPDGTHTRLATPAGRRSMAHAVSADGRIAGVENSIDPAAPARLMVWSASGDVVQAEPMYNALTVAGINSFGIVSGDAYFTELFGYAAFLYAHGVLRRIDDVLGEGSDLPKTLYGRNITDDHRVLVIFDEGLAAVVDLWPEPQAGATGR